MRILSCSKAFLALACLLLVACSQARTSPEKVVVVANEAQEESVALARYYMEQRGIPEENLALLKTPTGDAVSWSEYSEQIHNPLREWLVEHDFLLELSGNGDADDAGRVRGATLGHDIGYLVLVRGIPFRIDEDGNLTEGEARASFRRELRKVMQNSDQESFEKAYELLNKNQGSVDSELATIAMGKTPAVGFVGNPLYRTAEPGSEARQQVVRVTRLDGPSWDSARALVDHAIEAEKTGLMGRAYLDRGGPYSGGERWFERLEGMLSQTGYDLSIDREKDTLAETVRFDAPALYFGWYRSTGNVHGPFVAPGASFPPGAVAVHLHSFSAQFLRDADRRWIGPLVEQGVTATLGNVFEPTLMQTHNLDLFFYALAKGAEFGQAAYFSIPSLSWQGVAIGDPLYRPFTVSLDQQIEQSGESPLTQYAVIRKMNLLAAKDQAAAALELGQTYFDQHGGLPLAIHLAEMLQEQGNPKAAVKVLASLELSAPVEPAQWMVALEAARLLYDLEAYEEAFALAQPLIDTKDMPDDFRLKIIGRLIPVAGRASIDTMGELNDERREIESRRAASDN